MQTLNSLQKDLRKFANPERAKSSQWFFKQPMLDAVKDKFLGTGVPAQRAVSKKYWNELSLDDTIKLLRSDYHDERLTALFILVLKYQKIPELREEIYKIYLENTLWINNWDLVDSSAGFIVGPWLDGKPEQMRILNKLASSANLWERRIAVLSTFAYIKQGRSEEALLVINKLLHDTEDYIHKANGWMLREIGKNIDRKILLTYLDRHAATMPRTTLRYALEHLPPAQKSHYMNLKT